MVFFIFSAILAISREGLFAEIISSTERTCRGLNAVLNSLVDAFNGEDWFFRREGVLGAIIGSGVSKEGSEIGSLIWMSCPQLGPRAPCPYVFAGQNIFPGEESVTSDVSIKEFSIIWSCVLSLRNIP